MWPWRRNHFRSRRDRHIGTRLRQVGAFLGLRLFRRRGRPDHIRSGTGTGSSGRGFVGMMRSFPRHCENSGRSRSFRLRAIATRAPASAASRARPASGPDGSLDRQWRANLTPVRCQPRKQTPPPKIETSFVLVRRFLFCFYWGQSDLPKKYHAEVSGRSENYCFRPNFPNSAKLRRRGAQAAWPAPYRSAVVYFRSRSATPIAGRSVGSH